MKHRGPEMEYWIEVWGGDLSDRKLRWEFCSIHESRDEAKAAAEVMHTMRGIKVRVLDVAKWPVLVLG